LQWDYYRNLKAPDFRKAINLESLFEKHKFWTYWNHYDLYFLGVKRGESVTDNASVSWSRVASAIDSWIASENTLKIHKYRAAMAAAFGDRWFSAMRRLTAALDYLHVNHR
jgi:hypothetical protein